MPYSGFDFFLHTLQNCYKILMCNLITSIFGTNEECIKVKLRTTFAVNTMNNQGVMSIY